MDSIFVKYNKFFHDKKEYETAKKKYTSEHGDLFSLRNMFILFYYKVDEVIKKGQSEEVLMQFCNENFLNYKILNKIRENLIDLYRKCKKTIKVENLNEMTLTPFLKILFSMASGYGTNIAKKSKKQFVNWYPHIKTKAGLSKDSFVNAKANYIMYITLKNISGNKSYSICTNFKGEYIKYINEENNYNIVFKEPSMKKSKKIKTTKAEKKMKSKIKKLRKLQRRKKIRTQ